MLGGALATGDRLPAIRQLANDLGLAGGTVARAYRELEADGVVTTHGRHGTVIAGPPQRAAAAAPICWPPRAATRAQASKTGASLEDALTAVRVAFAVRRTA